ncbi:acyltransferase family protein [Pseudomonas sp. RIT-PI-S]|uniref:acyltransferase family protein n=1 Tax=Pseudomonas sp. RIT-PI-S TaxID=3035295 RepID=UPI0021D9D5E4|nr:acyltransferase family protein [Pseudomonas sp. RIT-PI-S]
MTIAHSSAVPYRPEVDGLRALAILPVVLYHAGVPLFSGGFVGVDVFFVISGYLITSIILAELNRGDFSLLAFYERRARRILPALTVMMLACLPLAWLWLDPLDLKAFAKSLVAVPLFSSNLLFWLESGYFDGEAELKPLIHTWTLGVEEQYYLLIPLWLMLTWRLGGRFRLASLAAMALASLAWAEYGAQQASNAAFFLLPARAWELLLGSFVAFYALSQPRHAEGGDALHQGMAAAGLGLLGWAVFGFDRGTPFPGLHALAPTLGAALLILFAGGRTWVGKVLGARPLVFIGLLSYSIYLWHQPLLAFARNRSLVPPSPAELLLVAAASMVVGWLSWRYVEQPFRQRRRFTRQQVFAYSALASTVFIAVGGAGYLSQGFMRPGAQDTGLAQAFEDPTVRAGCDRDYRGDGWGIGLCYFGAPLKNGGADVAVFGDSHSEAMLPAFDEAGRQLGLSVAHLGVGGCPPLLGVDVAVGNYAPGACAALAQRQLAYVREHPGVKRVVLIARWTLYTEGGYGQERMTKYFLVTPEQPAHSREASREVFRQALEHTVAAYRALGAQVDVVAQAPQQLANPKYLYYRLAHEPQASAEEKRAAVRALSIPVAEHQQLQQYTRALFERLSAQGDLRLVTLDGRLCDQDRCLIGDAGSFYKDSDHLNGRGIALFTGDVRQWLAQASATAVAGCIQGCWRPNPGGTPLLSVASQGPFGLVAQLQPLFQR